MGDSSSELLTDELHELESDDVGDDESGVMGALLTLSKDFNGVLLSAMRRLLSSRRMRLNSLLRVSTVMM